MTDRTKIALRESGTYIKRQHFPPGEEQGDKTNVSQSSIHGTTRYQLQNEDENKNRNNYIYINRINSRSGFSLSSRRSCGPELLVFLYSEVDADYSRPGISADCSVPHIAPEFYNASPRRHRDRLVCTRKTPGALTPQHLHTTPPQLVRGSTSRTRRTFTKHTRRNQAPHHDRTTEKHTT